MIARITIFLLLHCFIAVTQAQSDSTKPNQTYLLKNGTTYTYEKPKFFDFILHIPTNYALIGKETVKKQNLKWLSLITASTLLFLPFDQDLVDESIRFGKKINLPTKHRHHDLFGGTIVYPKNSAATLFYFGHGNTSLVLGAGLATFGFIKKDYRSLNTASEIVEGILTLGVMTQGLKRVFGRQSPTRARQIGVDGGEWNFFPGIKKYFNDIPNYDAMPSGHLATLISSVTILSKNYPDKKWIKPIGYTMAGLMSYEMMNSEVHWFTDYPLGFIIGYGVGSVVANRRIKKEPKEDALQKTSIFKYPELKFSTITGINMIGVGFTF